MSLPHANNKGADQPAHLRSLISAFVVRCLDSIISLASVTKISSLMLASVADQAGLSLTWSETPKTGFLVTRLKLFQYSTFTTGWKMRVIGLSIQPGLEPTTSGSAIEHSNASTMSMLLK